MNLSRQIAWALLARGISGSVSADCSTVYVDDPDQLTAAVECLAKNFPEVTRVIHQLSANP